MLDAGRENAVDGVFPGLRPLNSDLYVLMRSSPCSLGLDFCPFGGFFSIIHRQLSLDNPEDLGYVSF